MASITFWGNNNGITDANGVPTAIAHAVGSGLGFYGIDYGLSVPVGQYQTSTWVTNANGTAVNAYKLNNIKYTALGSGSHNGGIDRNLKFIPNYWAPLRIRFSHDQAVMVQNCKLRIFDRNDIEKNASGVITEVYEVRHPSANPAQSGLAHRPTPHEWIRFLGSEGTPSDMLLTSSPGISGYNTVAGDPPETEWLSNQGTAHMSNIHDWYVALSASPDGIGSKTNYGLYFTCEYL